MLRGSRNAFDERAPDHYRHGETIVDVLRGTAERSPKRGIYVIDHRGSQEFRTYPQILEASLRVGAALQKRGIGRADRVLLVLPTGFEFVSAYLGALAIGAIPVPTAPPPRDRPLDASDRAEALLRMAERLQTPAALFATEEDEGARPPQLGELRHVMDVGSLVEGVPVGATPVAVRAPEIAYIQPTSGATGRRRAVELTHRNILANIDGLGRKLEVAPTDVGVSWLPLHSILGLVGVALFGVYWEIDVALIHPDRFLKRPDEWLHSFARLGGTLAAAPSFGYDYCVRRCQESNLKGLDLSNWRVALNGGEPVGVETIEAFVRRFGKYGFARDAFTPVYGLTEATLAVSFPPPGAPLKVDTVSRRMLETEGLAEPRPAQTRLDRRLQFVCVGTPLPYTDVMIIDHRGIEVADRTLGEIAVRGPNVMRGYFDRPHKRSEGGTRISGEWLMTGDLGYVADGELYVVARAAATIHTADGRRLFSHLIEDVVQRVDGVRAGSAVVFQADGDVLVAVEIQAGAEEDEIIALVRGQLFRHFRLEPTRVLCISPQSVPRSATGKVRRHLVEQFYAMGLLDRRARAQEFDGMRRLLQRSRHQALKLGQTAVAQVKRLLTRSDD